MLESDEKFRLDEPVVVQAPVERTPLPAEVNRRFRNNCPTVDDLKCVGNWLISERMCGPDCGKFMGGLWHANLVKIEEQLAQKYVDMGLERPAVKVEPDEALKRNSALSTRANRKLRVDKSSEFHDPGNEEYSPAPGTLGEYVNVRCGKDSQEWQDYLRIKGLFGVAKSEELAIVLDDESHVEDVIDGDQ